MPHRPSSAPTLLCCPALLGMQARIATPQQGRAAPWPDLRRDGTGNVWLPLAYRSHP